MQITKQVPHPKFPSFLTTIKYLGRLASIRKMVSVEQTKKPIVVLDPRTNAPFIYADGPNKGDPMIVWKAEVSQDFAIQTLRDFIVGFQGLNLHGADVPFSDENLEQLFDADLDVDIEVEEEISGKATKKTVKMAWAKALERKAGDRSVFDADPQQPDSAKQ